MSLTRLLCDRCGVALAFCACPPREAIRVRGTRPDAVSDPIGWRQWWMTINPGKTWADADTAWKSEVL